MPIEWNRTDKGPVPFSAYSCWAADRRSGLERVGARSWKEGDIIQSIAKKG